MRYLLIVLAVFSLAAPAFAQHDEVAKAEVFAGYSYLRASGTNLHGWNTSIVGNGDKWLGIAGDFSGHYHRESSPAGTVKESIHSFTFGPHFAYRKNPKLTPFAFTLLGVARESVSVAGVRSTETGFDTDLGGGLDWHVKENVAVRVFQANAAIAHLGGHTKTDFRLSFGLVFHLGKK